MKTAFALAAWLVLAAALQATPPSAAQPAADYYQIGPRDLIQITVYLQPDLTQEVRVGEDGTVNLPLVGRIRIAGQTVEACAQDLTARYKEYLYNPQITVFVKEYTRHEIEVSILGEVARPGLYRLSERATLLEAISQAGGLSAESSDRLVVLRRVRTGESRGADAVLVDTKELFTPAGLKAANVGLRDGDTVHVPRADHYFVFGEVARPGSYKLEKDTTITVLKAISLAGGFTDKAAKKNIKITREEGQEKSVIKATLDTQVRSQDIIIVPESFF